MRNSRGLTDAQNEMRELWFNGLEQANKEEIIFELEMLLKGVVCFGDPRNHPGRRRREPAESLQYSEEFRILVTTPEKLDLMQGRVGKLRLVVH